MRIGFILAYGCMPDLIAVELPSQTGAGAPGERMSSPRAKSARETPTANMPGPAGCNPKRLSVPVIFSTPACRIHDVVAVGFQTSRSRRDGLCGAPRTCRRTDSPQYAIVSGWHV